MEDYRDGMTTARTPYPTDVSDEEWPIWERYIPPFQVHPNFPEPKYAPREVLNAVFYRERTGCQWRCLPHEFPPWELVYYHYRNWIRREVFARAQAELRRLERERQGRSAEPTLGVVESLRARKTPDELDRIRRGARITDQVYEWLGEQRLIGVASRNPVLASVLDSFSTPMSRARVWRGVTQANAIDQTKAQHAALYEALAHHRPDIARAVATAHVAGVESWLESTLND